jgi:plasmid stabilization system protein ParE
VIDSVVIEDAAQEELCEAIAWYENKQQGLGEEFFDEVFQTLELIERHPDLGADVPNVPHQRKVRQLPLRRFPYSIVYRRKDTEIQVVAFAHHRRKPGYWFSR